MLVTTYQHDYVSPMTKRYDFLKRQTNKVTKEKEECQCVEEVKIEPPKEVTDQCGNVEWTGIAPMGRLVEPRIIPTKLAPEQLEAMEKEIDIDCFKAQPNRFLQILRTVYPDLYERLKQMPKDELNRRVDKQRLLTTYQIDYCGVNEYPEGIYESLKKEEETSKLNASKLLQRQDPCATFRSNVLNELERENESGAQIARDPCHKAYKPFKITFADSSRFITSGNNSHWRSSIFSKRANFSEYMDTINRYGCVIMRNNLHDHTKCINGKHCRHTLLHMCTNLK